MSRFFLHESETRICFMNSRHEWALLWSALNGHNVLARALLRVSNLRGLIKPVFPCLCVLNIRYYNVLSLISDILFNFLDELASRLYAGTDFMLRDVEETVVIRLFA